MFQKIDDVPLGGRSLGKADATQEKAPTTQSKLSASTPVVHKRYGEHGGGPKPKGIPVRRARKHERVAAQESPHERLIGRGGKTESGFHGRIEKPVRGLFQLALVDQSARESGRVCAPSAQVPRPVSTSGLKSGLY
jgi:hypothetical protein